MLQLLLVALVSCFSISSLAYSQISKYEAYCTSLELQQYLNLLASETLKSQSEIIANNDVDTLYPGVKLFQFGNFTQKIVIFPITADNFNGHFNIKGHYNLYFNKRLKFRVEQIGLVS